MASTSSSKSPYARLTNEYPLDSRSPSPSPLIPDDPHFAYSTSLRRSEPDTSLSLDFGTVAGYPATGSRYGGNGSSSSNGGGGGGGGAGHGSYHASAGPGGYSHHPFAHTTSPLTPSSHYATQSIQQTISALSTSSTRGLSSSVVPAVRELSGPNEFEVAAKPPVWKRFAGQFYESPLILLLLGSAGVSAVVGNYDDSASIIAAIVIVVTGES
jgi:Ca2+-transporting ATPase